MDVGFAVRVSVWCRVRRLRKSLRVLRGVGRGLMVWFGGQGVVVSCCKVETKREQRRGRYVVNTEDGPREECR
jgi:hypothetical protein